LIRSLNMSIIKQGIHPSVMNPIVCSKIILQLCYTKAMNFITWLFTGENLNFHLLLYWTHISINDCINGTLDEIRAMSSACTGQPTLLIYIDEHINIRSKSGKGAIMVDLNVGCPVQADDIALISSNVPFMQSLIDICVQYSKRWKFKFCTYLHTYLWTRSSNKISLLARLFHSSQPYNALV
jgi:hypothetical protein